MRRCSRKRLITHCQILIPSGAAAAVVSLPGLVNENLNLANQTDDAFNTVHLQTATKLGAYNRLATLISNESDILTSVTVTATTPEPATLSLLGAGLLYLGLLGRRCSVRK
jgi:hypothetical protein